ncbi:MAG TPA: hypothetical protein VMH03_03450 [Terriglobales bacterium]|nr:hypothetical protein [Terriglobales bacterium]
MKKWKLDRIISLATLASSIIAIILVLKKPQPVSQPMPPAVAKEKAQSFQEKIEQLEQPRPAGQPPVEVHLNADEVSAAIDQAAGALSTAIPATGLPSSVPSSADAPLAPGQPEIKDYQVTFDGDVARGQFVAQIGGKDVYVTLAGHLGAKDGYATFDPTEFKVGDLDIPTSLVNGALQKRLTEQRDRLKLPDDVGSIKVENGELVMTQK